MECSVFLWFDPWEICYGILVQTSGPLDGRIFMYYYSQRKIDSFNQYEMLVRGTFSSLQPVEFKAATF